MKRKGFTLIELLAVIVVLAIIAVIAIPIIANVIAKAKEGSAIDSAYGYIDAVNHSVAMGAIDPTKGLSVPSSNELDMQEENDSEALEKLEKNIKGKKPTYVDITFEKKKVKTAGLCIDGYNIKYENKVASISETDYCAFASVSEMTLTNNDSKLTKDENNNFVLRLVGGEPYKLLTNVVSTTGETITPDYTSSNENVATVVDGEILTHKEGETTVKIKAGLKTIKVKVTVENSYLLDELSKSSYGSTGEFQGEITHNSDIKYETHVYNFEGNQTWTTETVPNGGVFGTADDVGASGKYAQKMVIVRVNGDLTIDTGVTIKPYYTTYGGPKGFMIYVTGTLTNNGTIDNSHGAYAKGEDVYLWKNATYTSEADKYEYVPAVGGAGADKVTNTSNHDNYSGKAGQAGSKKATRATGGGGSGGIQHSSSGQGGAGTSYSGGSGGGAAASWSGHSYGKKGSDEGGKGGDFASTMTSDEGGGAGNPGGYRYAQNGTGGLLIIFANSFINTGSVTANGYRGGWSSDSNFGDLGGGGSGGGSINIFYKGTYSSTGTYSVVSYKSGSVSGSGGAGGAGTVTIGSIATGTFAKNS